MVRYQNKRKEQWAEAEAEVTKNYKTSGVKENAHIHVAMIQNQQIKGQTPQKLQ